MDNLQIDLNIICTLACVVFILALTGIVLFLATRNRKRLTQAARELGFSEVKQPSDELRRALEELFDPQRLNARLSNVLQRRTPDGDVYLFDLQQADMRPKGESISSVSGALALFSPSLKLPYFVIMPKIAGEGQFISVVNSMQTQMAGMLLPQIDFSEDPAFEQRCAVFGSDEAAVRQVVGPNARNWLASQRQLTTPSGPVSAGNVALNPYQVRAGGPVLVLYSTELNTLGQKRVRELLAKALRDIHDLAWALTPPQPASNAGHLGRAGVGREE